METRYNQANDMNNLDIKGLVRRVVDLYDAMHATLTYKQVTVPAAS